MNEAFAKGYKFAFQASSDHYSTHISYACVYATEASRRGIHDAMKRRHVYGATDNIIADFRTTVDGVEHLLGDEFSAKSAPELRIKLIGTAPFKKVTLIKDDADVQTWEPGVPEFEAAWTDPAPEPGKTSYYYARGEQEDGELVWVSPMWIRYES